MEGILVRAADELQALQEERKVLVVFLVNYVICMIAIFALRYNNFLIFQKVDPHTAEAIDSFLLKLKACASGDSSFTFVLDDPAGNSYIENP